MSLQIGPEGRPLPTVKVLEPGDLVDDRARLQTFQLLAQSPTGRLAAAKNAEAVARGVEAEVLPDVQLAIGRWQPFAVERFFHVLAEELSRREHQPTLGMALPARKSAFDNGHLVLQR